MNTSRLSHHSQHSLASNASGVSTVQLGGVDYPIGTRIGKTGNFVIGNPGANDPSRTRSMSSLGSSRGPGVSMSTVGSQKQLTKESYPTVEGGHNFEEWNWTVIRFCCLGVVICAMIVLLAAVIGIIISEKNKCQIPFNWLQGSVMYRVSVPYFNNYEPDSLNLGDLKGIKDKAAYMTYLGVQVCNYIL